MTKNKKAYVAMYPDVTYLVMYNGVIMTWAEYIEIRNSY